jgi:hypothetical protein
MIDVTAPVGCTAERDYILRVLFGDWLGIAFTLSQSERTDVSIRLRDLPGELRLPDSFFNQASNAWMTGAPIPEPPLPQWDTRVLAPDILLTDPLVPVLFGDPAAVASCSADALRLPIDLFGSAFFMLSRYEEAVQPERDDHDRFPSTASLARRASFLDRPIVDEYAEILWAAMVRLWPNLERHPRQFRTIVSHDVDSPGRYAMRPAYRMFRACAGDLIKYGNARKAVLGPWYWLASQKQLHRKDPYNTFDWIMDQSEQHGLTSAFYFICGRTDPTLDSTYEIEHPAMRALLRLIHHRGHEIGLHPSYNSYRNPDVIVREAARMRRVCAEEGIQQAAWGGRMHYLRWATPITLHGWEEAGMTYDSTLSYADRPGFRCGTCHEYPAFDLFERRQLTLRIRPLIAMECSVTAQQYMGLGPSEAALETFTRLKKACESVRGDFTLLWHNSQLSTTNERELYRSVLAV